MNPDDIVTMATPDGSDTITVTTTDGDTTWLNDITIGDTVKLNTYSDEISGDMCDTFTYASDSIKWDDIFEIPKEIKVGDRVITEEMIDKLAALVDMIEGLEDDNALKELFNTQLGMNKIRGNNDET